jgi:hypothetical protein
MYQFIAMPGLDAWWAESDGDRGKEGVDVDAL